MGETGSTRARPTLVGRLSRGLRCAPSRLPTDSPGARSLGISHRLATATRMIANWPITSGVPAVMHDGQSRCSVVGNIPQVGDSNPDDCELAEHKWSAGRDARVVTRKDYIAGPDADQDKAKDA